MFMLGQRNPIEDNLTIHYHSTLNICSITTT